MIQEQQTKLVSDDQERISIVHKRKQDLVVLRYMVLQVRLLLQAAEQTASLLFPQISYRTERQHRLHRICMYQPSCLLQNRDLACVGFVSGRQPTTDPVVAARLHAADQNLLTELVSVPGLLSYSSLEVRPGRWYNLVIFHDRAATSHVHTMGPHRYAAYELAPQYYAWIRLHHGSLPEGLAGGTLLLFSTKQYTFPGHGQRPLVQTLQ